MRAGQQRGNLFGQAVYGHDSDDYASLLAPRDTQRAIFALKRSIEDGLCSELNLMMVTVPLIVDIESGVNDYLDRDGP